MSEMQCWMVLSDIGITFSLVAEASPAITEHMSLAAARSNALPVLWGLPALGVRNTTRYDASVAWVFTVLNL